MSVGYVTTKSEIDTRAGDIARRFQQTFGDVATLKSFLDDFGHEEEDLLRRIQAVLAKLPETVDPPPAH